MLIDMHMLLVLFILALQMHTDMGDERGIRLRCISLGRAALRGSRTDIHPCTENKDAVLAS